MERAMSAMRTVFVALVLTIGTKAAPAQNLGAAIDFEGCRVIADSQARLDCLRQLLVKAPPDKAPPDAATSEQGSSAAHWPLIRTPKPKGGPDAVAVMRTADTSQSDPDLAGLMFRCRDKPGLEVVLALVRPFPPRSKRDVAVESGTATTILKAETTATGTALVLPVDATMFTTGPWRTLKELSIRISDQEGDIHGVVPLDGVRPAIAALTASCPPG